MPPAEGQAVPSPVHSAARLWPRVLMHLGITTLHLLFRVHPSPHCCVSYETQPLEDGPVASGENSILPKGFIDGAS